MASPRAAPTGPRQAGAILRKRYPRTDLFALVLRLNLRIKPQLELPDRLLDEKLFKRLRDDLACRHPRTRLRGHPSTPVEVILWMLWVMRLYSWSYAQAEHFVNDSLVLRQFCRVNLGSLLGTGKIVRLRVTGGAWLKTPSCKPFKSTAISQVSGSGQVMAEN